MKNRFKLKDCFIFALILTSIVSTMPVMAFAETTDGWVTKAPMSTPRTIFQSVVLNGKIYAIGGRNGSSFFASMEEYNPQSDTWSVKAPMSTPRAYFKAEVIDGKIYAIGGSNQSGYLSSVEVYDPQLDTWTARASMSIPRDAFQAEVINGKIYAVGGWNSGSAQSITEEYNPVSNTWITKTPMPSARNHFQTEVFNGKIYAIGGNNGHKRLSTVEEYDSEIDAWTTKAAMHNEKIDFETEAVNGKIYAIGGTDTYTLSTLETYDPLTNIWTDKTPMSNYREDFQTTVIGQKIYAIGGVNLSSVEEYDLTSDTWTAVSSMSVSRSEFHAEVIGGKIYAIGGSNKDAAIASVEEYTPVSSQPETPTTLTATAGDKQVSLSWSPVTGAASYNIYRSTTSGSNYSKIASDVTSTTYTDTGLTNGVTYYYYVTAIDSSGTESQPSNEASATPTASSSGGYNATLKITMVTGEIKEYNVNSTVVESFIAWFNSKGSESPVFTFEKTSDLGPYTSHTDYLAYNKISSFIVLKY